jgi:hypothetical protein
MGTNKKSKKTKSMKNSFNTQKATVNNLTNKHRRGLTAICNIEKGDFITYYGTIPYIKNDIENNIENNKMCIFTNKKIYAGDPSESNPLSLGQFANDHAFDMEMISLIKEGDVNKSYQMYKANSENNNNANLVSDKKPYLVAKRDILAGEIIYVQNGLSYWIIQNLNELNSNPNLVSRINTFALNFIKENNDFMIIYDKSPLYKYDYHVVRSYDNKMPVLVYENEEMSEGYALMILCNIYKLNRIYVSFNNLPSWIYDSPYKALLYLNIVIGIIPKNINNLIFQTMTNKEYKKGYEMFLQYNTSNLKEDFVNYEDFVYYYKHWNDLFYILHKNNIKFDN